MRILITNTYYFPAFVGGAEISVKLLAEGMFAAGNTVYVLTTGLEDRVYRVNGVVVISIKQQNIFNSYEKRERSQVSKVLWHLLDSFNFSYHNKIKAILKRVAPDIVHTNSIQGFSPFLWRTIKSLNIPLVHSMRDYYMLCHKCNMYNNGNCQSLCAPCGLTNSVKKGFFKYPDHFIGISNFILDKYNAYSKEVSDNSSVIYNAVDTSESSLKINATSLKVVFGYIGRIDKDKGVEYMVDELALLSAKLQNGIKLVLAGKGEVDFVNKLEAKLVGIEHEFLGVVKPADFYSSIDVLIVPALWNEPFGRIVIESLSNMVPVCQSDRGGLKELYSPDSSWIFSPQSGHLLAQVTHILNNRDELAEKKLNCVNEAGKFSVDKYIDKHQALYKFITACAAPQEEEEVEKHLV
ncbi:glycosyltransferase family 4 protein [Mucilaginibacter sp. ZT4R22]|uniref:Glycosyltransferase family 4 protein n=1 Tax=Mucilaginibacter pankratovii TaxID=2772110 RepID=A0ABR7WL68_9SPHI|nr:glycosyltransferase family 4 protein [Mucilaginibacter pankratovii]MBD1363072.1 glycosyltransferase family 4 protein [Mucilaginibacter pankratovii]